MTEPLSDVPALFKGRHFNHLLIIHAVRWYITYKLGYRDVRDLMAERGFKKFRNAKVTLGGIELAARIKKGQFDTSAISGTTSRVLQIWEAAIAA